MIEIDWIYEALFPVFPLFLLAMWLDEQA